MSYMVRTTSELWKIYVQMYVCETPDICDVDDGSHFKILNHFVFKPLALNGLLVVLYWVYLIAAESVL